MVARTARCGAAFIGFADCPGATVAELPEKRSLATRTGGRMRGVVLLTPGNDEAPCARAVKSR